VQTPLAHSSREAIKRRMSTASISEFIHQMMARFAVEFVAPERGEGL